MIGGDFMYSFKRLKSILCIILLLTVSISGFVGCSKKEETGYDIFYKNGAGNQLVTVKYESETKDTLQLTKELIDKMKDVQKKSKYVCLMPEYVVIEDVTLDSDIVSVYFNKGYNDMPDEAELLLRMGLVKTITQLPEIKYVQIYVENAVAQYSDGKSMWLLDADDFVDDSVSGMASIEWREVDLYYSNSLGDKLVRKRQKIAYSKNVSLEKVVMERLISGPSDSETEPTLPSNLKLLSISVVDSVCYVNLDSSFLTEMVNVSSEIPVYSIVNTLCSLKGISSVQIMINGDTTKAYRDTVPLDSNLQFNYDIISATSQVGELALTFGDCR